MNTPNWERWGAASGYAVLALGVAAAAFERGAPPANAPIEDAVAYFVTYRRELLAQSLLFVLSAGVYLWFFGSLRSFLRSAGRETARLATVAFGAGVSWAALQLILQSFQVALARVAPGIAEPAPLTVFRDLTYALSVIAYVPMGVVLAAVALVALRTHVLPPWLGWFSAVAAIAHLVMAFGIVADNGLLVAGRWPTYVLYALIPVWLAAVTTVMVVRLRNSTGATAAARSPASLHN